MNLPNWAKAQTEKYLSDYPDWHQFLAHVDTHPVFQPGNPVLIGAFSNVRDQQSRIEGAHLEISKGKSDFFPHRKMQRTLNLSSTESTPIPTSPRLSMEGGSSTRATDATIEDVQRRLQNLTLESRDTQNTGRFTNLIQSYSPRPIYKDFIVQRLTHEAKINTSFINFLYTICLLIPTDLKWDTLQRTLNFKAGHAKFTSIIDGGLFELDGSCQILVEVKAQALTPQHSKSILMQQGLEILSWIATTLRITEIGPVCKSIKSRDRSVLML